MKKPVFVLLIFCSCYGSLLCQPIVKVYGNQAADSLETAGRAYRCLQLLGVDENVCVCIRYSEKMPQGLHGTSFFQSTMSDSVHGQAWPVYRVRINAKDRKRGQEIALAHELVHIKQYVKGELHIINARTVLWNGRYYQYLHTGDRFVSPWEQEAYRIDQSLAEKIRQHIGMYAISAQQK